MNYRIENDARPLVTIIVVAIFEEVDGSGFMLLLDLVRRVCIVGPT